MIIDENKITPDEGKTLTNGKTYSKLVFLGKFDKPENWKEIPDEEVPSESEDEPSAEDKAEAYDILMGVSE